MDNVKPIQKAGYIHVKIPTKTHGIRIKTWKRKWLSLHQMSDLSSGKSVAKLELYHDHDSSKKYSILLDNVRAIKRNKSRTMEHAFDLLDDGTPLRIACDSETECQGWMDALRDIFWPIEVAHLKFKAGAFIVSVIDNNESESHALNGRFVATVSPTQVDLLSVQDGARVQSWKITTLKRFFIAPPTTKQCDSNKTISFVANISPAKDQVYTFFCEEAVELLASIKRNVDVAFREKTKEAEYHEVDESVNRQPEVDLLNFSNKSADNLSTASMSFVNAKTFSLPTEDDDSHEDSAEEYSQLDFHKMPSATGRRRSTFSGQEDFNKAGPLPHSRSASQLTVRFDFREECIVDESGYSHLPASTEFSQNPNKARSFSNSSSVSQKSTSSRQSRDSGIAIFRCTTEESEDVRGFRNDSVDSAWDDFKADDLDVLSVSGKSAETVQNSKRSSGDYENIELQNGQNCDGTDREEIYEDLDEIRKRKDLNTLLGVDRSFNLLEGNKKKNLEKFLGYDKTQKEKPPSLPDRPVSSKLPRKKTESPNKTRSKWNTIPLFTSLKAPDPSRGRSFSTSSSGSEDEVNALIQKMGDWSDPSRPFVGDFKAKPATVIQQSSFSMSRSNVVKNSLYADIKPKPTNIALQGDKIKPAESTKIDLLTDETSSTTLKEPPVADLLTFDSGTPPVYQNVIPIFNSTPTTSATTRWTSFESHSLIGSPKNDDPFDMMFSFNPSFKTSSNGNTSVDDVLTNSSVISSMERPKNDDPFDITWAQAILSPTKVESPSIRHSTTARANEDNSQCDNFLFSFDGFSNTSAKQDTYDSPVKMKAGNPFSDIVEVEEEFYMDMTQSPKTQRHLMPQNDDLYITMATK